jgi:DNA invertase Pin-like site-specific DNA recombinase
LVKNEVNMTHATGYIRVSTLGQAVEGVSVEMQEAKIRQWAALNDAELVGLHVDEGLSGKNTVRPGLQEALLEVKKHKGALVVYSLSRLSRSTRDTLELADRLEKVGADLVVLQEKVDTTTPSGRMVFRMLAAMNEFEREQLAERTSQAMQHMKAQGRRVGNIPHGYRLAEDEKYIEPDANEQEVLRLAAELRRDGWTLQAISDELAKRGAFNRAGRPFNAKSIRSMVLAA